MSIQRKAIVLLAKRIKRLRVRQGITLEKLAYENDLSKGNLSDIENAKRSPSLSSLLKIARGLDCRVKDLFDF
jgi:transcriptional regulator with XRE-family HTH domain